MSFKDLVNLKVKLKKDFLKKKGILGIGIGYKKVKGISTGEICIVFLVEKKIDSRYLSAEELIPESVSGIKTDVIQTGLITAPPPLIRPLQISRTSRIRPAPGGVSIGHVKITAGTLGCLVKRNSELLILSNNHVLANENRANIGDHILQPGPYDGGIDSKDVIATLKEFVSIDFRKENKIDAALALPLNPVDKYVTKEVLEIGVPSGYAEAKLNDQVIKSGRTTGITRGKIITVNATVKVQYSSYTAIFENQLVSDIISRGGDSGSAVFLDDGSNRVCGLLFAGSETNTIINPIKEVLSSFKVDIDS